MIHETNKNCTQVFDKLIRGITLIKIMTYNTGEKLDNPANPQSENSLNEIIPATGTETNILNQETENMEVHHHPDLHHKPKKWKEYFLEFLMIFLAVTMGFFAENVREHIGERKKETEYIKGLVEDFETDTSRINQAIKYNEAILHIDTSFIRLLYGSKDDTANLKRIYKFLPVTKSFNPESTDSRTFDLLKNTGDLKLIKNELILNKVSSYYRLATTEKIFTI